MNTLDGNYSLNFPREKKVSWKNDRNANDTVHYASDICLFLSWGNSPFLFVPSRETWHRLEWHRKWSADLFIKTLKSSLKFVFILLKNLWNSISRIGYKISTLIFDWLLSRWLSTTLHKSRHWKEEKMSLRLAGIMSYLLEMFSMFPFTITTRFTHIFAYLEKATKINGNSRQSSCFFE
jgi:hypothetical protein